MSEPLLAVRDLEVTFARRGSRETRAVAGVSFDVAAGATLGLVGESGCGKSVTSLAILGLLPDRGVRVSGSVRLDGRELVGLPNDELRRVRGRDIAMVFQDPMTSLNPVLTIGRQITEVLEEHTDLRGRAALDRAAGLLDDVGIPGAAKRLGDYPHQFSGGMRQRAMIAIALACQPRLLIADEPTTALDVTIQAQILELLNELVVQSQAALMLITHDLGVVAGLCETVHVMYAGRIVESAHRRELFAQPRHPYTAGLLASVPRLDQPRGVPLRPISGSPNQTLPWAEGCAFVPRCPNRLGECIGTSIALLPSADPNSGHAVRCVNPVADSVPEPATPSAVRQGEAAMSLLEVRDLRVHYPVRSGLVLERQVGAVRAVDGVSFSVDTGETLGLVGESGCGKSTVGKAILKLTDLTSGQVCVDGVDVAGLHGEPLRRLRRRMQMIFQDPYSSLDPRRSVEATLLEPLRAHRLATGEAASRRVGELLDAVGLPASARSRYPHEFSGGQRQRIGIARALAVQPDLLIADEPVSALDVSIQAQVVNLLEELQERFSLAYLVIAHDLAVVRHISDRIAVMYLGTIVELASADELYVEPLHPYTIALLSAIPIPDPVVEDARERILLSGDLPSPADPPDGCRFHTRCPFRQPTRCHDERPELRELLPGHTVACHWAEEIRAGTVQPAAANVA